MSTFDLRKFDQAFAFAPATEMAQNVPDGRYQVIVETVDLTTKKTTAYPILKWKLRITGPRHANRMLWKNSEITELSMSRVKSELRLCGYELDKISPLEGRLFQFQGLELEIMKKGQTAGPDDIFFEKNVTVEVEAGDELPF